MKLQFNPLSSAKDTDLYANLRIILRSVSIFIITFVVFFVLGIIVRNLKFGFEILSTSGFILGVFFSYIFVINAFKKSTKKSELK